MKTVYDKKSKNIKNPKTAKDSHLEMTTSSKRFVPLSVFEIMGKFQSDGQNRAQLYVT